MIRTIGVVFVIFTAVQSIINIDFPLRPSSPPSKSISKVVQKEFAEYSKLNGKWKNKFETAYTYGFPSFYCEVDVDVEDAVDVNHLRPENIKIIGAIGDSLSAARAARALTEDDLLTDYKGVSFVTGNDEGLDTQGSLANIFRRFNPSLVGASRDSPTVDSGFNVAVSGSFSEDVLKQAVELVQLIKDSKEVDFENDWKFINLFVGSNDLCKICTNFTEFGVDSFQHNMIKTVGYIRDNLPRTYLNIMPPVLVNFLLQTQEESDFCVDFQKVACPCITQLPVDSFAKIKRSFDDSLSTFYADSYQTDTFVVGISPGANVEQLPQYKDSLNFAVLALDCFHFSQIMHDAVSKIIWKNLFEPIGGRTAANFSTIDFSGYDCPTTNCPYLTTLANSKSCQTADGFLLRTMPLVGDTSVVQSKSIEMTPIVGVRIENLSRLLSDAEAEELEVEEDVVSGEEDHAMETDWVDEQPTNESNPVKFTGGVEVATERISAMALVVVLSLIALLRYRRKPEVKDERTPLLRVALYDEESLF